MSEELNYLAGRAARGLFSRRAFMGRAVALGATTASAGALLSSAVLAAGPKKGGRLSMGLGGGETTNTLDPALMLSKVPYLYMSTLGNYLVTLSPESELIPSLAESWKPSADAKSWAFKIRKGVEFHNGKTMTVEDVLLTIQRHADKASGSGAYGVLKNVADLRIEGGDFVVTLHNADAEFPYVMADQHLVIQPGGGIDDPATGIFTGPYKLKSFNPGVRIVMEKFENHWDSTVGHYDEIEVLVVNDVNARNTALTSGQVQMINEIQPRVVDFMKRAPNVAVPATVTRSIYAFSMFCDTAPFDDNDVRMALKLAIDREEMVEKILYGYGSVGNDMPVNEGFLLFDKTIPQRHYDPEQAAHYYKKSGHSGPIVLRTTPVAFPGAVDAALLFQQSAKKAGINIKVQVEPADGYWSSVWNKKPFAATYWSGRPVQGQQYTNAYISSSAWNDTRFKVPKFDAWIKEAQGEMNVEKRKEIYSKASRYIRDNGGLINPLINAFLDGYRTDMVAGWVDNPNAELMNFLAPVNCWQV